MDNRERDNATPPHYPTHGVHLSNETISALVHHSLPDPPTNLAISQLPHGMSFNNRIYIVDSEDPYGTPQSHILKVNGKFFGPTKIENEVSCLLLLKHFCSNLPVPHVIAWSAGGSDVVKYDTSKQKVAITATNLFKQNTPRGWILMTRLPGQPIDPSNLSSSDVSDLSAQLAHIVSYWQRNIPKSTYCGNIFFSQNTTIQPIQSLYKPDAWTGPDLHIHGLLGLGINSSPSMDSLLDYWRTKLSHSMHELSTKSPFETNKAPLLPLLENLVSGCLPRLSVFTDDWDSPDFTFVHTDLAPQNILVSGNPPQITGIIDFEFSGFFPSVEEFIPTWVTHEDGSGGDWPSQLYRTMLQGLEKSSIVTPLRLQKTNATVWRELEYLHKLELYIAPWWLAEGGVEGVELNEELERARKGVETAVSDLQRSGTGNSQGT